MTLLRETLFQKKLGIDAAEKVFFLNRDSRYENIKGLAFSIQYSSFPFDIEPM